MPKKMKLQTIKLNQNNLFIEQILIIGLIFVTSWKFILPSTWFDEVFLVIIVGYFVLIGKKVNRKYINVFAFYIIWCILGALLNRNINMYTIFSMLDNLKPILIFCIIISIKVSNNDVIWYKKWAEIINFPSVLIGILNGYLYNILGRDVLIDSGTLKYYGTILVHRSGGLIGHSGEFTELCAILFLLVLFIDKNTCSKYLKLAIYAIGIYCGRGRFPLALIFCGVVWYLWLHISKKNRKRLIFFVILSIFALIYPIYIYFINMFSLDIEYQIRFVALRKIMELLPYIVFFGVGCGAIGNTYSADYNSQLYRKLSIERYSGYDWESTFAKCMIQTGVIGTVLWFYVFFDAIIKMIKKRNAYRDLALLLMIYYVLNCFINKSYVMPMLAIVSVLVSSVLFEQSDI